VVHRFADDDAGTWPGSVSTPAGSCPNGERRPTAGYLILDQE
jgi:hypothetical protein